MGKFVCHANIRTGVWIPRIPVKTGKAWLLPVFLVLGRQVIGDPRASWLARLANWQALCSVRDPISVKWREIEEDPVLIQLFIFTYMYPYVHVSSTLLCACISYTQIQFFCLFV